MKALYTVILIVFMGLISNCAIVPSYRVDKVEQCYKVEDVIYCDNDRYEVENTNKCSIYDSSECIDN